MFFWNSLSLALSLPAENPNSLVQMVKTNNLSDAMVDLRSNNAKCMKTVKENNDPRVLAGAAALLRSEKTKEEDQRRREDPKRAASNLIDLCSDSDDELNSDKFLGVVDEYYFPDDHVSGSIFDLDVNLGGLSEASQVLAPEPKRVLSEDGRIYPAEGESIESFLHYVRPSNCQIECSWIQVERPGQWEGRIGGRGGRENDYRKVLKGVEAMIREKKKVSGAEKKAAVANILRLAKEEGRTTGKWMLFPSAEKVDAAWSVVARAVVAGELDCSAKVSPTVVSRGTHLICVYCDDFTDRRKVRRVLEKLRENEDTYVKDGAGFKPDIFTNLGIYSSNEWRLPPTIFTAKEILAEAKI